MAKVLASAGHGAASTSAAETGPIAAPTGAVSSTAPPALPLRAGHLTVAELIELYMAWYSGRDPTRVQRLTFWKAKLGRVALQDLSDDDVHAALEDLAQSHGRYFAGKDADGQPIVKAKRKPMAPATVNRYSAALAAVVTWAIKRRIAPKAYVHPCRSIERRPENNEKSRFLSDDEMRRLLDACRASKWDRLYLLVLMALTTGARRGELLGLRWRDVDLERGEAHVGRTKNGDPRILPLVPEVAKQLDAIKGAASTLIFPSRIRPDQPFDFKLRWDEALREARIRGLVFHDLRHSCASYLAKNGATLLEIADLLGHRQLQMTKRYSHLATSHKKALVTRVLGDIK